MFYLLNTSANALRRFAASVLMTFALLSCLGCGARPYVNAHIESVNAEYRQLEDYVYALEEENGRLQQELGALKSAGSSATTPASPASPSRSSAPRRGPTSLTPRLSPPTSDQSPDIQSPTIELPGSPPSTTAPRSTTQRPSLDLPQSTAPADTPPNIDVTPLLEVPAPTKPSELLPVPTGPRETSKPLSPNPTSAKPGDKKVTHLFLNPALTGTADFDGQAGDDGLRIVMEPRNAADEIVREPGSVAIVVLDPDQQGERARIARWDFDCAAMRQLMADSSSGRGIKLEMPWPATVPDASRLKLYVRYETPDGHKVQADREIFLTHGEKGLSRWTPRSTARQQSPGVTTASNAEEELSIRGASPAQIRPRPLWSPQR